MSTTTEHPAFFQPGRAYQRRRWIFQCLAVAPAPHTGETRAVGFVYRDGETGAPTALDPDDWTHGQWTDTTPEQPAAVDPDDDVTLVPYHGEHGYPAGESPAEQQSATVEEPPADWVADVRTAIAFNLPEREPALETLRDVLLDTAPRTPEQALAAARLILAQHTREHAAAVRKYIKDYSDEHGVNRRTRGLITGMGSIRRLLDQRADAEARQ